MFTAEEFENFDIFPKKLTYKIIFKSIFYVALWTFGFIILFSFYIEQDISQILSGNYLKNFNDNEDTLINRLSNIAPKNYYLNSNKYYLNYSDDISNYFFKKYILDSYPCLIKNGSIGFNIINTTKYIINEIKKINEDTLNFEKRIEPFSVLFQNEIIKNKTNYSNFIENIMNDNKSFNIINEENIYSIINNNEKLTKIHRRIFSKYLKNPLLNKDLLNIGIFLSEGKSSIIINGHSENTENFICLTKGNIEIILIPPNERKFVYPFKIEFGQFIYSPINFFNQQIQSYPNFKKTNRILINISIGDCLYIPSYWWRSIKTNKNEHFQFLTLKYKEPTIYYSRIMD